MRSFTKFHKTAASLILFALSISTLAQNKAFDTALMDTSVEACEDFYQYANGTWLKNAQIPAGRSRYRTFDIVAERPQNILRDILEKAANNRKAAKGGNEQLIGDFYASCMDETAIEAAGTKPIDPFLKQIEKIRDSRSLQTAIAELHKAGLPVVFSFGAAIDAKNSSMNIASASQRGISLPTRDYYLDEKFKDIREKFAVHVANTFALLGEDAAQAKRNAEIVLKFQTRLAQASKSRLELRDADKNYNKITLAELQKLTPDFDWNSYAAIRNAPQLSEINVGQPRFFEEFNRMLTDVPVSDWKTYLRWMVLTTASFGLPKKFTDERFNFYSRTLGGIDEEEPRWKRCVADTGFLVGEALGQEYVKRAFQPEAKKRMNELIDNLFAAYRERIGQIDWMSRETKEKALVKLNAIKRKVGYNENLRRYSGLKIDRKSYFGNFNRSAQLGSIRNLQEIGKPADKTLWSFEPYIVNGGYTAQRNEIEFPAALLQPPFFNFDADDAINYGAIGQFIGHEITHGFDNRGSRYDAEGNLKSWWLPDDRQKFEEKASCLVNQYSGYEVLPGLKMNGELTLPENIADLGGLSIAYDAFKKALAKNPQPKIDGFTPEQRFFLSFARSFAAKLTPEAIKQQVQTDPHSFGHFRVNGVVSNMPEFAEAFGCKTGKPMVRENRCQIW